MQTACNIIPSPNDPALNAPTETAFDLLTGLEETQYAPEPLTNAFAVALAAHGPDWQAKAQKIQDCTLFSYIATCKNGHILGVRTIRCNCRFSPCCRDEKADETIERWKPVIDHITDKHHAGKHVLLELRIPAERSREAAAAAIAKVSRDIATLCDDLARKAELAKQSNPKAPCFHGEPDSYWVSCLGFWGDNLVIRVLTIDRDGHGTATIPTPTWRDLWPDAHVSVTVAKHPKFRSAFNHLVKPLPLTEPADCAEQEVMFYRMQMLRAHKISLTCPESLKLTTIAEIDESEAAEELSVGDYTDNSETEPNHQHSKGKSTAPCPVCGDTHVVRGRAMRSGSPELTAELIRIRESSMNIQPPG